MGNPVRKMIYTWWIKSKPMLLYRSVARRGVLHGHVFAILKQFPLNSVWGVVTNPNQPYHVKLYVSAGDVR